MPVCVRCRHAYAGRTCPACGGAASGPPVLAARGGAAHLAAARMHAPAPVAHGAHVVPGRAGADEVAGVVLQTHGPTNMPAPTDIWRLGCILLGIVIAIPIVALLWLPVLAIRLAIGLVFGFGRGRGRSLLDEIVFFRGIELLTRRPDPVPVYRHVVDTDRGQRSVRQEGEFIDGHPFVGHRVQFEGRLRGGTLVVERGYNETLQTPLGLRPTPWRGMLIGLLAVAAIEYSVLFLVLAGGAGMGR